MCLKNMVIPDVEGFFYPAWLQFKIHYQIISLFIFTINLVLAL